MQLTSFTSLLLAFVGSCGFVISGTCQDDNSSKQQLEALLYTTPAYQKEALHLLLGEANDAVRELHLPEQFPITERDLVDLVIDPPRVAEKIGGVGVVGTTNYEYCVSVGKKLSFITSKKLDSGSARNELKARYLWPTSRRNTNAAYKLATNWLASIQMDVKRIEHDCNVYFWSWTPDGVDEQHFVPIYWVYWIKRGEEGNGSVASVELLEPTRLLGQLRVERPEYILRGAVEITNMDDLLSKTNLSNDGVKNSK